MGEEIAQATYDVLLADTGGFERTATLDIDDDYYAEVFERVPNVSEDHAQIRRHNVLVDGDEVVTVRRRETFADLARVELTLAERAGGRLRRAQV